MQSCCPNEAFVLALSSQRRNCIGFLPNYWLWLRFIVAVMFADLQLSEGLQLLKLRF